MPKKRKLSPSAQERAVVDIFADTIRQQERTVTAVAASVGISQPQLSQILAGDKPMSWTEFLRLCQVLGLDASTIVRIAESRAIARGDDN